MQNFGIYRCYTTDLIHELDDRLNNLFSVGNDINFGNSLPCIYIDRNSPFMIGGLRFYSPNSRQYSPKGFVIKVSEDGYTWKTVFTEPDTSTRLYSSEYIDCKFEKNYRVRYVSIKITSKMDSSYLYLRYFVPYCYCNN